jgi:demethylmenaquinone methyltransferase / 2-methoxy-6-polyprenyl-1,4-benzoquinol methylase
VEIYVHVGFHQPGGEAGMPLGTANVGGAWKAVGVPQGDSADFDGAGFERAGTARATLDKRRSEVAAMFDRVAARYDLANDVLSLGQDRAWRRQVVAAVEPRAGQLILDLAAGTGTSSEPFGYSGATVIPTDLSFGMLLVGKQRRPELSFVAADALQLPYADASFDAVTISFGLRNVEDTTASLNEMRRVIKPGGTLVICEFSTPAWRPFRTLYSNYLVAALPRIASLVSSSPAAYEYLAESIQAWPDQQRLATMIENCGWRDVEWRNLSGGIVALHRGRA